MANEGDEATRQRGNQATRQPGSQAASRRGADDASDPAALEIHPRRDRAAERNGQRDDRGVTKGLQHTLNAS